MCVCTSPSHSLLEASLVMKHKLLTPHRKPAQAGHMSVSEINCLACREGTGVLLLSHYLIVLIYDYNDYRYYAVRQNVVACGKR